jgi:hypothetical protein
MLDIIFKRYIDSFGESHTYRPLCAVLFTPTDTIRTNSMQFEHTIVLFFHWRSGQTVPQGSCGEEKSVISAICSSPA